MWRRIVKIAEGSIGFAVSAHFVMDLGVFEPWPFLGRIWWFRTLKGAVGVFVGWIFWELLIYSLKNGRDKVVYRGKRS